MAEAREVEIQSPKWYVARTNVHQEKLARASLHSEGVDAYLPLIPKTNRKGELFGAPLFPSFLFVRLVLGEAGWTKIFSARGISSVLGIGGKPSALPPYTVELIRSREVDAFATCDLNAQPCRLFKSGEVVRFRKGSKFAELEAVFLEVVDSRRCQVLIQFLGDSRIAEAELAHIE